VLVVLVGRNLYGSIDRLRKSAAGAGEQVSLVQVAAKSAQAVTLFRDLDALGDDLGVDVPAERREGAKELCLTGDSWIPRTSDMSTFTTSGSKRAKLERPA
jgi:hypothetical protein